MAARVKKGDRVIVIAGKNKGRKGEVLSVLPKEDRVLVAGVNIVTRHQKAGMGGEGGLIKKEAPIHVSNVAHLDPKEQKPTRVGFKILEDGRKVRIARRSGEQIDR